MCQGYSVYLFVYTIPTRRFLQAFTSHAIVPPPFPSLPLPRARASLAAASPSPVRCAATLAEKGRDRQNAGRRKSASARPPLLVGHSPPASLAGPGPPLPALSRWGCGAGAAPAAAVCSAVSTACRGCWSATRAERRALGRAVSSSFSFFSLWLLLSCLFRLILAAAPFFPLLQTSCCPPHTRSRRRTPTRSRRASPRCAVAVLPHGPPFFCFLARVVLTAVCPAHA